MTHLLPMCGTSLLKSLLFLLLKLGLQLSKGTELFLERASHFLHLSGHGDNALRVLCLCAQLHVLHPLTVRLELRQGLPLHPLVQLHGLLHRLNAPLQVHLVADLALVLHDLLPRFREDLLHLLLVGLLQRLDGRFVLVVLGVEGVDHLERWKNVELIS